MQGSEKETAIIDPPGATKPIGQPGAGSPARGPACHLACDIEPGSSQRTTDGRSVGTTEAATTETEEACASEPCT